MKFVHRAQRRPKQHLGDRQPLRPRRPGAASGGALGAYQIGVYQALAEAECEPSWISGVSPSAHQFGDYRRQRAGKAAAKSRNFLVHGLRRKIWAYTPEGDIFRFS